MQNETLSEPLHNNTNKKLSYRRETARQLHVFLGSLTDRALHWAPLLFYNYIGLIE